jgi:beta-xylosidase
MSTTYNNPIIPGFAPDPSVVFVKDTFFLVDSSFPGLPIYASRDLATWTQIGTGTRDVALTSPPSLTLRTGNAINKTSQLDLSNATTDAFPIAPNKNLVATLDLFAPTIRWHNGVFYIICTNASRKEGGDLHTDNFIITSTDIWADEWSDPIWFEFDGIDPSLLFDDFTGKVYVQASWREGSMADRNCSIRQFEIDVTTGKRLSDVRVIWKGGDTNVDDKSDIEGPHMYHKDGFYYLLAADGGTFEEHKAVMARSRDIWSPFEVYEKNPVLTAAGTEEYVQNVGHADLFQDGFGAWWAVALRVRNESGGRKPTGRETFLIPVDWPTGEWPVFGQAKMQFERFALPEKDPVPRPTKRVDDVYIRDANLDHYKFSEDGSLITLIPSVQGLSATHGATTFIGKRQRSSFCTATATLHVPTDSDLRAGLALYKENLRHVEICYDSNTGKARLRACFKMKGEPNVMAEVAITSQKVQMQISATTLAYDFFIRTGDEMEWILLGSTDALEMTACDFNGTLIGVFANTTSQATSASVVKLEGFSVS